MTDHSSQFFLRKIIGFTAMLMSVLFLIYFRNNIFISIASIYFIIACYVDAVKMKIPNILNASLLVSGFLLNTFHGHFHGAGVAVLGICVGFLLVILPHLLGGMGAGDVKALASLGALTGPSGIFQIFLYTGLYGGGLALLYFLFQKDIKKKLSTAWQNILSFFLFKKAEFSRPKSKSTSIRFPYSSAIAFGYYSFMLWGDLLVLNF